MALYTAPFGRRIVALALDGATVAVLVGLAVYGGNALGTTWTVRPFDPFWEERQVMQTTSESVGAPSVVKEESGIERTTAYSRETRVYDDGAIRIFAVIEASVRHADGTETSGRAANMMGESRDAHWRLRATYGLIAVIALLYYGVFESSSRQATPGKQALGLRVTDLKGQKLPLWRVWFRQLAKAVTLGMSGFGYLTALFTMKAQTVHDIIAGTLVVTGRSDRVPQA
jgi:uncharacterized RDD family membrane protein YckC